MTNKTLLSLSLVLLLLLLTSLGFYQNFQSKKSLIKKNATLTQLVHSAERKLQINDYLLRLEFDSAIRVLQTMDTSTLFVKQTYAYIQQFTSLTHDYSSLENMLTQSESKLMQQLKQFNDKQKQIQFLEKYADSLYHDKNEIALQLFRKDVEINKLTDSVKFFKNRMGELNFVNANGVKINYFGEIKEGAADGFGIGFYSTGGTYKGEWKLNKRHGNGSYVWANKDKYEGNFADDKRHGQGVYTFESGDKYVGNWEFDLRSGEGSLMGADGKLLFKGKWHKNEPVLKN